MTPCLAAPGRTPELVHPERCECFCGGPAPVVAPALIPGQRRPS